MGGHLSMGKARGPFVKRGKGRDGTQATSWKFRGTLRFSVTPLMEYISLYSVTIYERDNACNMCLGNAGQERYSEL